MGFTDFSHFQTIYFEIYKKLFGQGVLLGRVGLPGTSILLL